MAALPELDSPKVAGALVIGALLVLAAMRRGFKGVSVGIGD